MVEVDTTLKVIVSILGSAVAIITILIINPVKWIIKCRTLRKQAKNNELEALMKKACKESNELIESEIKVINEKLDLHNDGLLSLEENSLTKSMEDYKSKGYAPIYIKKVVDKQFKNYRAMGGNGILKALYGDFISLPEHKQDHEPR